MANHKASIVAHTAAEAKQLVLGARRENVLARFTPKVKINETSGCWEWQARVTAKGYSSMSVSRVVLSGHIVSYLLHKGEIGDGLEIDHTCRNRGCVNPEHLEAVTMLVNRQRTVGIRQKPACKNGHEYKEGSYKWYPKENVKRCRICSRNNQAAFSRRQALKRQTASGFSTCCERQMGSLSETCTDASI